MNEPNDYNSGGLSKCCGAEIKNGFCSDCKEHAEPEQMPTGGCEQCGGTETLPDMPVPHLTIRIPFTQWEIVIQRWESGSVCMNCLDDQRRERDDKIFDAGKDQALSEMEDEG
mgnify:CR=1 FL=1